jgi:hypothetical protein
MTTSERSRVAAAGNHPGAAAVRPRMKTLLAKLASLWNALTELDARTGLRPVTVPIRK